MITHTWDGPARPPERPESALLSVRRQAFATRLAALTTALVVSACGGGSTDTTTTAPTADGVRLVNPGKLTMCTNVPFAPFEFKEAGKIVGFDVDIVDLVARKLAVTQDIIDIDFAAIKSGAVLDSHRCDVAAAGLTITAERRKNIDFSVPYFDATQGLMAKKGSGFTSLDDVKTKGLKLGATASTTGLDYVTGKGLEPIEFADSAKTLLGLDTGQVDVIVQDLPVVLTWLKKPEIADKFELVARLDTGEQYGIGMRKGNTRLAEVVNQVIETAKADGTYNAIYKKWLGAEPGLAS